MAPEDPEVALAAQLPGRRARRAGTVALTAATVSSLALFLAAQTSFTTLSRGILLGALAALCSLVALLWGLGSLVLSRSVVRDAGASEAADRLWGVWLGLAAIALTAIEWSLISS